MPPQETAPKAVNPKSEPQLGAEPTPKLPNLDPLKFAQLPKVPAIAAGTDEAPGADQTKETPEIPEDILKKATLLGFTKDAIKLEGNTWVGCTESTCTPLGTYRDPKVVALEAQLKDLPVGSTIRVTDPKPGERSEFVLSQTEAISGGASFTLGGFGQFTRNPDNKTYSFAPAPEIAGRVTLEFPAGYVPKVKVPLETSKHVVPATMQQAREYVESHPNEAVVILVTVPKLCPPCVTLESQLPGMVNGLRKDGNPVTVLKIEHETFERAKEDTGEDAKFPFMAMFARGNREEVPETKEVKRGPVLEGLRGLRKRVFGIPGDLQETLRDLAQ